MLAEKKNIGHTNDLKEKYVIGYISGDSYNLDRADHARTYLQTPITITRIFPHWPMEQI